MWGGSVFDLAIIFQAMKDRKHCWTSQELSGCAITKPKFDDLFNTAAETLD